MSEENIQRVDDLCKLLDDLAVTIRGMMDGTIDYKDPNKHIKRKPSWEKVDPLDHEGVLAPTLYTEDMAAMANSLASELRATDADFRRSMHEGFLIDLPRRLKGLKETIVPCFWDDDKQYDAVFSYITSINYFYKALNLSKSLADKIKDAANAAAIISGYERDASETLAKTKESEKSAQDAIQSLNDSELNAKSIVVKAEKALELATTYGLASEFDKRAKRIGWTMIGWGVALLLALFAGAYIGLTKFEELAALLGSSGQNTGAVGLNSFRSIAGIGAAIWVAWLSTKQIGQRFRLGQDYAFKATIAKVYEGYKAEAGTIGEEFKSRLFGIALSRLDEHPLRYVEHATHGSPWHELLASKFGSRQLGVTPEVRETLTQVVKQVLSERENERTLEQDTMVK